MEKRLFKTAFSTLAKKFNFTSAFGGWYKQSKECIVTIELQRSNYSHLYYLNIYFYIQGYNGQVIESITKEILKGGRKDNFRREEKNTLQSLIKKI